jgi:hypothetical protein
LVLVNTLRDEVNYWKEESLNANLKKKERATYFKETFVPLADDFGKLS